MFKQKKFKSLNNKNYVKFDFLFSNKISQDKIRKKYLVLILSNSLSFYFFNEIEIKLTFFAI